MINEENTELNVSEELVELEEGELETVVGGVIPGLLGDLGLCGEGAVPNLLFGLGLC